MQFFNREKEKAEIRKILELEPSVIYFVYGPINSGKTALITEVIKELPGNYRVFYFNFRRYTINTHHDFYDTLFEVEEMNFIKKVKYFLRGPTALLSKLSEYVLEYGANVKIPIPKQIFDQILEKKEKGKDVFSYLEQFFRHMNKKGIRPILIIDELQRLKGLKNNGELLSDLFNFFVGMTKETHLCHCLALTSDSLFVEYVYNRAELQKRAKYVKVDDLSEEESKEFLINNGFSEEEALEIYEWLEGNIGDLVSIVEEKKKGKDISEMLKFVLTDQKQKLKMTLRRLENYGKTIRIDDENSARVDYKKVLELLRIFTKQEYVQVDNVDETSYLFLVQQNILFFNPVDGILKPQSKIVKKAIEAIYLENINKRKI